MRIAIRVDASDRMGTGHLMRCLTLADALHRNGAAVRFVSRSMPQHLAARIAAQGHQLRLFEGQPDGHTDELAHAAWLGGSQQQDAQASLAALADARWDAVVVDHYALDWRWQGALAALGARMAVIDDLADRRHACDVLLDQNYAGHGQRYAGLLPAGARLLAGPAYALLRPEFAHARGAAAGRSGALERVFLFFGGVDQPNLTATALRAVQLLGGAPLAVDVVVGKDNPHQAEVAALCAAMPDCRLHLQVDNIAALMAASDLAIGAGGATTWERCCVGLASVVVTIAANQEPSVQALARGGYVVDGGSSACVTPATLAALLAGLLADPAAVRALGRRSAALVDGEGCARVARVLGAPRLSLRAARAADVQLYYEWASDDDVRAQSFNSAPIPFEQHQQWFARRLDSDASVLLVALDQQGEAVGQVRFEQVADGWQIGFSLDRRWRGQGLAVPMLAAAIAHLAARAPQALLLAQVKRQNSASSRAFVALGFVARGDADGEVLNYVRSVAN